MSPDPFFPPGRDGQERDFRDYEEKPDIPAARAPPGAPEGSPARQSGETGRPPPVREPQQGRKRVAALEPSAAPDGACHYVDPTNPRPRGRGYRLSGLAALTWISARKKDRSQRKYEKQKTLQQINPPVSLHAAEVLPLIKVYLPRKRYFVTSTGVNDSVLFYCNLTKGSHQQKDDGLPICVFTLYRPPRSWRTQ